MPQAVRIVNIALSWLAVPVTVLAVAGVWALTRRAEMLACTGTAVCASAWSLRFVMCRVEWLVMRHQDSVHVRQAALIRALADLACGPSPAEDEPTELRAVP